MPLLGLVSTVRYTDIPHIIRYDAWHYYEGESDGAKPHGFGTMHYGPFNADGYQTYVGSFNNGLRCGKGVLTWKTGAKYTGDFVDDKFHGNGKYETEATADRASGTAVFEGLYSAGVKKGVGTLTITCCNGYQRRIRGEWNDEYCTGTGEIILSSGGRFTMEGTFRNADLWNGISTRCFNGFITRYTDGVAGEEEGRGGGSCCVIS